MNISTRYTPALFASVAISTLLFAGCSAASSQENTASETATEPTIPAPPADDEMRVTLLGTGSPVPSDTRYGTSTLVQAGDLNLIFDAGRGASIRTSQAGIPAGELDGVFITHFHSDHVNGLSDLWLTGFLPAFGGRDGAFEVYGPTGVDELVAGLRQAHSDDIDIRLADGDVKQRENTEIEAQEFSERGVVFDQDGVTVTMFEVLHDPADAIDPAVGYRIDYGDHSVLISGDTVPHDNVIKHGTGVDLLVHEVAAFEDPDALPAVSAHHTTPRQAGEIFAATEPRMAAYTHIINGASDEIPGIPEEELINRTRENYDGPLTVGEDLTSFLISDEDIETHQP